MVSNDKICPAAELRVCGCPELSSIAIVESAGYLVVPKITDDEPLFAIRVFRIWLPIAESACWDINHLRFWRDATHRILHAFVFASSIVL